MGRNPINIITQNTKAIFSKESSYYRSIILEGDLALYSAHSPENIIENSCIIYGSTLTGRREYVKKLLELHSKIPIPVNPDKGVYLLPTCSTKSKDCVWLSYYHIDKYEQRDNKTYIHFTDGTGLYVNASAGSTDMQYKRTSQIIAQVNRKNFFD